ncbi:Mitogen-activated protein kinase kinase kinase [Parasponia andersonii]|uniref:non-specific serine/threonine protein kinase n=1 Tax=Parasponia andersonii TaxID=3476 RepID=A0A2P5CPN8_PARAD|nr:Mitogen-activated protein kinase kinase kinase [Parasponia andersonii]
MFSSLFKYFHLLFFSLFVINFVPSVALLTNETDKIALLEFKSLITSDPFQVLDSWNESFSFCHWVGVTCGHKHQARVTSLHLHRKNLGGTISPHIGNLSFLRSLDLGENLLRGEIPPEASQLSQIRYLNLSFNFLHGGVPVNLSHCYNLIRLDLGNNNLTKSIPFELGLLTKLEYLTLYSNSLTGSLPASLANLSSLQWLSVGFNYLEGEFPSAIAQMKSLRGLRAGINNFSGVFPPPLYNLSNLEFLSLTDNLFSGDLLPEFGSFFPKVQILYLGGNQFTGSLPVSLSNSSSLRHLDIPDNNLTGNIPMSYGNIKNLEWLAVTNNNLGTYDHDLSFLTPLANCSNLYWLDIGYNHYGGSLPLSVANLSTQMSWLLLGGNQIGGTIPPEISNLVNLTNLCVQDNLFVGSIPESIGKLSKLTGLSLQLNKFTGPIPFSLGNLIQLSEFDAHSNGLEGPIPTSLANCQQLRILDLSANKLNGTIPGQLVGLPSLSVILNFSYNSLSGSIPLEVEKLIFLVALDLSNNNLTGELPSTTLGSCIALETLYLQGNFFHGNVPDLNLLKSIKYLDISRNNLSGQIPIYLAKSFSLENLNLSMNNLEGEVPEEGIFKNTSAVELFGNSRLCGGIKELRLRSCPHQKHKKHFSAKLVILIVSPSLCLALILSFTFLFWLRKSKKSTLVNPVVVTFYQKVSYEELAKATNDFSPANSIGSGHFGTVYKGAFGPDEATTRVAVKVLNLQCRGSSQSFMAECQALRNIRHRNLVKVLTVCSSIDFDGNEFKALVYELMPKGSLERWLHPEDGSIERTLSLNERLNIAIDVASALQYLHHQCQIPVIHCDIKPSNVLLDDALTAKLSDFGLARLLLKTGKDNQFSSFGLKGTIGYAAPEYGMGEQVSTIGDVYSYGILLLEMFTGRRPTNEIFKDDMNLHNFVKMALMPGGNVVEIVDQSLLQEKMENIEEVNSQSTSSRGKEIECLTSLLQVGIACSAYSPRDRKNMTEIVLVLFSIRVKYLGEAGVH